MSGSVSLFLCLIGALCVTTGGLRSAEAEHIGKLIGELASESFKVRESATRELWKIGDKAIPALREASRSEDPERAFRASDVLEKVELRITPETSGKILSLIDLYRKSPTDGKAKVLAELKRHDAYFQLLKLYSAERPETRIVLRPSIGGFAIMGAREAIVRGDTEEAIELLRLSAGDHRDMMALANIYRTSGRLESELGNPDPPESFPPRQWKITLLRAKGDLEGATELAAKSKMLRLVAALKVLSGDPVPWLRQNGSGDGRQQAQEAYIEIALKRWKGEPVKEKDFAPLYRMLESPDVGERAHAMTSLASLGKLERVENIEVRQNPAGGFVYHISQENIGEALAAIGLDPENPDYGGWVEERFENLRAEEAEQREEGVSASQELIMMAGFLERRGLHEKLAEAFSEPLASYAKDDDNRLLEFLASLFEGSFGAPRFAADEAARWAGEDEGRWKEVYAVAFGSEEHASEWLDWIREIDPGMGQRETLDAMLAIFGKSGSPGGLRGKWMKRIWEIVGETADEKEKLRYVKRILSLSVDQEDVTNALRAWDMLDPEQQSPLAWTSIDRFLSAVGRWEEAAEVFEKTGNNRNSSSPEVHAYLAASLRRAGLEERAREHDEMADKLALGYAPSCNRIGSYYAYAGDRERARLWYRRAVLQADVSEGEFLAVLDDYADSMLRLEKWDVAASCYEALVQVYASQDYVDGAMAPFAKERLSADLAKAMAVLPGDRKRALEILEGIHDNFATDGVLADDFFPLVRRAGLDKELVRWFGESWERIAAMVRKYPESHNTRNTAAWFASRAVMKLDEAEEFLLGALEMAPEQPAYLDTMAEVKFARGDRKAALRWSDRAVSFSPFDDMIRLQNERFRSEKLPGK